MKYAKKTGYLCGTILFLLMTVGPFIWTFIISITLDRAMFAKTTNLLPKTVTWVNYAELFSAVSHRGQMFFTGIVNSLQAVGITLCIGIPIALMSAYVLARMEFKGRKLIKNLLLITMVIPVMATIIPLYRMFSLWKLLNNILWLSMVYVSSYLPLAVWLISNHFATIPIELEEAAMIDGCSKIKCFFKVILPLSYPIILSITLIIFLNTWSQFQIPLILASSMETKPMAIVISEFMTKDSIQYGLIAAAGMIALIPPAFTALIFRKHLISGMMRGAVKG
ncbi:MAG: carbohydrate ABC transporter permease [Lachnospiraceae bacterium]